MNQGHLQRRRWPQHSVVCPGLRSAPNLAVRHLEWLLASHGVGYSRVLEGLTVNEVLRATSVIQINTHVGENRS
jgi:hypothetical protein